MGNDEKPILEVDISRCVDANDPPCREPNAFDELHSRTDDGFHRGGQPEKKDRQ